MCTTDVKKYIYPDGRGRIVEQKYLCSRSDGVNPCSSHTRRESSDWVALNTVSLPSSPAASLIQDAYPSPSSPSFPSTPSSANVEVREPSFLGRSSSLRDKGQRRTKRYYINGAEIKVTRSGNRKGKEKAYDKGPSAHKKHHSDDDVVIVNVGGPPSVFEAPTPPPAAPSHSQPGNAFAVPPPPPPPPSAPRIPLSLQQPPTPLISDRRRRPRPQVIITDQRDANPPAVPSSSPRPSTPLRRTTFGDYLPRQSTPPTYQTTTHFPGGGDNEVLDRQAAREEARRDNKRRAEAKKKQQEEQDAQIAAALARKLKLEQGEEYLAQLEQNRFAARDAARDKARKQREEEEEAAEREREERRESDRLRAEQERLDHELAKAQAALDETRAQMARERRDAENREAHEQAERLEREVRQEEEQLARLQRQRQQEEIRRAEQEVRRLQERGRERGRSSFDDPRRRDRLDGPRFGDRREIRAAPRRDVDVVQHSPRDDRRRDSWRDRGERVIADARAQARSQDLNRGLGLEDEEDERYRSYGRRYYWEGGRKRYY